MTVQVKVTDHFEQKTDKISLNHYENPAVKHLLDVIVSILAQEYVQTAKKNPEIFSM